MALDIRIPLGLLFTIIGGLLEGYGLVGVTAARLVSIGGLEIDRAWGAVLIAFGVGMLMLAFRHARRTRRSGDTLGGPRSGLEGQSEKS